VCFLLNGDFGKEFQVKGERLTGLNAPDNNDWALLLIDQIDFCM